MKFKLIWRQLLLVLLVLFGLSYAKTQVAQAAASGVTGSANYGSIDGGIRLKAYDGYTLGQYVQFSKVTANNIQDNRLTRYTTQITVTLNSSNTTIFLKQAALGQAYLDVLDAQGTTLLTSSSAAAKISGNTATFSPTTQTLKVNLSNLGTAALEAPIYVGVTFAPKLSTITGVDTMWMGYGFGEFKKETTATDAMKDVTIDEPVQINDQKITGTAEPGIRVSTVLQGKVIETTADSAGKYTLTLDNPLALSGSPDTVTVVEGNDMGDTKSATATVHKSMPILKSTSDSVSLTPALLETLSSDDDVLAWLVDEAGITVQDSVSQAIDTNAKYSSTDSDLAQKLTDLASGDSTTIDVGATSNGVKSLNNLSIKVTKTAGELKFTTVSDALSYGSLTVPSTTTLFAPVSAPDIQISDTRTAGSPWHITATAGTLTDGAGHNFSGQLMYVDSNGQSQSLAAASTVASGTRAKGVTTVKTTAGWENQTDKPSGIGKPGIYLQAKPNIYTGGGRASYSGDIDWQLVAAP